MRTYFYKAREENGKLVSGEMTALNEDELARKLRGVGYMPTSIQEVNARTSPADAPMPAVHFDWSRWRRIDPVQMIMFTIRLSSMIDGGIPLLRGLDISIRQTENIRLKRSLEGVYRGISGGMPFSEALAQFPGTFSPLFINIVKSGEVSGNLKLVLNRYAQYLEQQEEIRQRIKNATFYPAVLLCAAMGIFLFMVTFIIPKFIDIFAKAGVELPLPTFVLYHCGIVFKKYWYLFGAAIVGAFTVFRMYKKTASGKRQMSRLQLRLPVAGDLIYKMLVSRFCRSLATLLKSGVPMLESLHIVGEATENTVMADLIQRAGGSVEKGEMLAATFAKNKDFPEDVTHMITVGEETGKLGDMLDKIANFYDTAIDHAIKRLLLLIEPILIVIMGCFTGFIMASMILPLFDMVKTIQR